MKFIKKFLIWISLVFLMAGCGGLEESTMVSVLTIDAKSYDFEVIIADDVDERNQGLQNVSSLGDEEGMWFIFEEAKVRTFWMKDTLISLDIIFIGEDFKVLNIAHDVPPCTEIDPEQLNCSTYSSDGEAQYVFEIKGGLADYYGIKIGDIVRPLNF